VISNLPFGKQVGTHRDNELLYPGLMGEIARTLRQDGRAVLLTEDKRLLVDSVARTPGLKIIRERLLRYNGASPTAYVIMRTRTVKRRRS
jgi:23S rRNA G2445 N2-methylase RlmL